MTPPDAGAVVAAATSAATAAAVYYCYYNPCKLAAASVHMAKTAYIDPARFLAGAPKSEVQSLEKDMLMGRKPNTIFNVGITGSGPLHVYSTLVVSLTFT